MQQHSWMRPSLADGWTSPALDTPSASPVVLPRARVALGAASPVSLSGGSGGRTVALGDVGPDVWGDPARAGATQASAPRGAAAPAPVVRSALTPFNATGAARAKAAGTSSATVARSGEKTLHSAGPRARPRLFEFIGHGALSVTSSITGKHYRFAEHGAQLPVDPRDWSQLSRVPSLRAVVV